MLDRRNVISFAIAACLLRRPAMAQDAPLPVVASFSILGDIARQIGGGRVAVTDLVAPDQDSHSFQPSPRHARSVGAAKVILVNGLGFEPYLARLVQSSGATATPTIASAGVRPLERPAGGGHGHDHGGPDPHAWQSVANVRSYARTIAAAFRTADPAGAAAYDAGLSAYLAQLDALENETRAALAAIPDERRMIVTTHDSFRYFAAEFGMRAEALQGVSAESEPSAADMARIIRQLKRLKAPAVFLENVTDPRKLGQIGRETGAKVGGVLYSDALSLANGPAATYIDMMRHNVRLLVETLK